MVKSSCVAPPLYWPWTSMPGLMLRIRTSPSTGDVSAYVCVTASTLPTRRSACFWRARSSSAFAFR